MHPCCPPGHGCNAAGGAEPCALELCRSAAAVEEDAALALKRWKTFEQAREGVRGELRFRRRAFERARDRALIALAMAPERAAGPPAGERSAPARRARGFRRGRRGGRHALAQ
jgi:hypothetical protein